MLGGGCPCTPLSPSPAGGVAGVTSLLCLQAGHGVWGGVPSCAPSGRGASHLGTGGTALSGTARLSSFTLRRRTLGWWPVTKQVAPAPLGGLAGPPGPPHRGGPHPEATYIISVLARGAGGTTGTHGTLGEMQGRGEGAVGDSCPLSPRHPGWAVPGSGSPDPADPG